MSRALLIDEPALELAAVPDSCFRDRLLGELIFAARATAEANLQLGRALDWRGRNQPVRRCRECEAMRIGGQVVHAHTCNTGRVLRLVAQLMAAVEQGR